MKARFAILVLLITILLTFSGSAAGSIAFPRKGLGVSGHPVLLVRKRTVLSCWICAVKHSLLFGTSESTVSPDRKITWGEIITILGRVHESVSRKKLPQTAGERFYSRSVSWAKSSGLLKNIEIAAYFAEQSMTRECYGWVQEQFLVEGYYAKIEGYFE